MILTASVQTSISTYSEQRTNDRFEGFCMVHSTREGHEDKTETLSFLKSKLIREVAV